MINVNFENATDYRQFIGENLYRKSIHYNPDLFSILEIGPDEGNNFQKFLDSEDIIFKGDIVFLEPNLSSSLILEKKFPSSKIISSKLEQAFSKLSLLPRFDLIIANFSLHWVENLNSNLAQLAERINDNGLLSFSNTDSTRSFWALIDRQVKSNFIGCSLFNIDVSHSLSQDEWLKIIESLNFKLIDKIIYDGTATLYKSIDEALIEFKRVSGEKYLKLTNGYRQEQIEDFVKKILIPHTNNDGKVSVNASGYSLIFQKMDKLK